MCRGLLRKATKMADKIDGNEPSGRTRMATPNPAKPKPETAKPKRKAETPTLTDDLTGKFLRIGNALYRTSANKKPIARLEPDRLKTTNIDALPDIVRIAHANRSEEHTSELQSLLRIS